MNVVVDHGNSSAKIGIFNHHVLKEKFTFSKTEDLQHFLKNFSGESIIISSVNQDPEVIKSWVGGYKNIMTLSTNLPLPVINLYHSPDTLGVDRIAAVCGAWQLFTHHNCLVIDAGTCITYDFIDDSGQYFGGGISPGLSMRFKAVNTFTARLPLVEPVNEPALVGNSTVSCIQSGVIFGVVDEIDGIIRRYSEKYEGLKVILCGGDTPFFENKLKASIFASPELVLRGLNSILLHNVNC